MPSRGRASGFHIGNSPKANAKNESTWRGFQRSGTRSSGTSPRLPTRIVAVWGYATEDSEHSDVLKLMPAVTDDDVPENTNPNAMTNSPTSEGVRLYGAVKDRHGKTL